MDVQTEARAIVERYFSEHSMEGRFLQSDIATALAAKDAELAKYEQMVAYLQAEIVLIKKRAEAQLTEADKALEPFTNEAMELAVTEAARRVLEWVEPIAGDNRDVEAAMEEILDKQAARDVPFAPQSQPHRCRKIRHGSSDYPASMTIRWHRGQ